MPERAELPCFGRDNCGYAPLFDVAHSFSASTAALSLGPRFSLLLLPEISGSTSVRPWTHRHGGTQTPIEYMEAKKEAESSKGEAARLTDEVYRLRQMLSNAGIDSEGEDF